MIISSGGGSITIDPQPLEFSHKKTPDATNTRRFMAQKTAKGHLIVADIPTLSVPRKHILFAFEIAAYEARYDVTVDYWRTPLAMRVKDMARVHWADVQGVASKYTPNLTPEDEIAADWQFENAVTDAETFGWPHPIK